MKIGKFKPGDRVMLLRDDLRKMKVVDYVVNTRKTDGWKNWGYPVWEDDVLVECSWPDKLGLPHYEVFNEEDLVLIESQERKNLWHRISTAQNGNFNRNRLS